MRYLGLATRAVIALASAVLLTAWVTGPAPLTARLLPLFLFGIGLWKPTLALIVMAGIAPVIGLVGVLLGMDMPGVRLLEQLAIATVGATVLKAEWPRDLRLLWPGACFAIVVVASVLVVQPVWLLSFETAPSWSVFVDVVSQSRAFEGSPEWQPTTTALRLLLGIGVALCTESALRKRPEQLETIIVAFGVGAGIAAGHNLQRLLELHPGEGGRELLAALSIARINTQTDVNAGGSLFALASFAVLAAVSAPGWRRWSLAPVLPLVLVGGLWLSGSRSALASAVVAVLAGMVIRTLTHWGIGWRAIAAAGVTTAILAGAVMFYPSTRNFSISASLQSRRIFAETAVSMWAVSPIDGVGVGTFYGRSSDFGAAAADEILVTGRTRENAHNYPLQVVAELGVLGLLPYLLLIVPTVWRGARPVAGPTGLWLAAGLAAYLASSLTGHPQLLSETVLPFWVVLGCLAALIGAPARPRQGLWAAATAGLLLLVVTAHPVRADRTRDIAVLENRGIGLTRWQSEEDGHRFRLGGAESIVFVPTGATVTMPFAIEGQVEQPVPVAVIVDGVEVNQLVVAPDEWADIRLSIRPSRRHYVDLRLMSDPAVSFKLGRIDAKRLE